MQTVVDSEAAVLRVFVFVVEVSGVLGTAKALLLPILMDAPQDVHTLIDGLLVAELAEKRRSNCPKSDVLELKFE